ncbi:hypothetical protein [Nocardia sp. X0981]
MQAPISRAVTAAARKAAARSSILLSSASRGTANTYRRFSSGAVAGANRLNAASRRADGLLRRSVVVGGLGGLALVQIQNSNSGPDIESGLDSTVLEYTEMSPFLREHLHRLQATGWRIGYGDSRYVGETIGGTTKKIIIDNDLKDDPLWSTAVLAHEVGHAYPGAFEKVTDPPIPGEKYGPWLERNMRTAYLAEAESGLVTAKVRREILDRGGPDIGNISDETIDIYELELAGELSHDKARDRLADVLSRDPYAHYRSEYKAHWDENYADSHGPSVVENGNTGVPNLPDGSVMGPEAGVREEKPKELPPDSTGSDGYEPAGPDADKPPDPPN